jgi:UDP-N-acetylmuramate dehydrogenase
LGRTAHRTDFSELIRFCRDEHLPLFVIGRGSNLLVRDGGIRGVVVHPRGGDFEKIEVNGCEITAGAGVKLRQVAYAARAANLGGLEWMEGIPGTVGGGLRMNAGAMGAQTFENVSALRYLDAEGNSHVKNRNELEVFYRRFPLLEKNFAVSATFCGQPAERGEIDRRLRESQEKRRTTSRSPKAQAAFSKILPPFQPANWWTN